MKPHYQIPIIECHEPLLPLPDRLCCLKPHPYRSLGAPYGDKSPYYLRPTVITKLEQAQKLLSLARPGWQIAIFDAYRPVAVQQFMVDYAFQVLGRSRGIALDQLSVTQTQELMSEVLQFWAIPSLDPSTPPPHSTGAAIDLTLIDANGIEVDMGSPIDEISPRSFPGFFESMDDGEAQEFERDRQLLGTVMTQAGFQRHPNEWWHFSFGDQMWAWQTGAAIACFGRADLISLPKSS